MGAWRRPGLIDQFHVKLMEGMREQGLSDQFAEQVFRQIRGFGEYGFPESHAASFALLVYISAWLKCYYPAAFTASLINSQPMGFYGVAQLVSDAKEHEVEVLSVDINHSTWDCTLEGEGVDQLRLGFRVVSGLSQVDADVVVEARQAGAFCSSEDVQKRTRLSRATMMRLAQADAFRSLKQCRRQALWHALGQEKKPQDLPLFRELEAEEDSVVLPQMPLEEEVVADYHATRLSLKAHPISFYRQQLDQLRVTPANGLDLAVNNRQLRVAGLVLLRQRPSTAKGITFVTLEDETGKANLVLHQQIWEQFYTIARRSPAWIAHGRLERQNRVTHVIVNRLEDLSEVIGDVKIRSRDFR